MNRVLENTQKMLDKLKWLESEKQGVDMSGCMPYCMYCGKRELGVGCSSCRITQEDREKYYHCVTPYKRMTAKNREKAWLSKNV